MWWVIVAIVVLLFVFAPGLLTWIAMGSTFVLGEIFDSEFLLILMVIGGVILFAVFIEMAKATKYGPEKKKRMEEKKKLMEEKRARGRVRWEARLKERELEKLQKESQRSGGELDK